MSNRALAGIMVACTAVIVAAIVMVGGVTNVGDGDIGPIRLTDLNISVSPEDSGSVSPLSDQEHPSDAHVTLIAIPVPGNLFSHWEIDGQISYLGPEIEIPTNSDKNPSVTAVFVPESSPRIHVALDYFGIKNTLWMSQIGGASRAKIQLVVQVRDDDTNLATFSIPPAGVQGFYMDFFEVIALDDYMSPTIFADVPTGSLTVSIAAYNVNKGPITKAQIDFISKWTGTDWSLLKDLVPDRELVGACWRTWSASDDFGVGRNYLLDDGNLKAWLRVGSAQEMPDPVSRPVLRPNVEVVGELPAQVRTRTTFYYNSARFTFTLTNHESFRFPIYWRLETDSDPGTTINYIIYPTEGTLNVPGHSSLTRTYPYWFRTPGEYKWRYVAEYPRGNPVASWEGTLTVAP